MALPMQDPNPWVPEDTFGARIALVRQHRHWNMTQAAEACGVSPENWRNWEAGRQPRDLYDAVKKISAGAGCDPRWLLGGGTLGIPCFPTLALVSGGGADDGRQMELDFDGPAKLSMAR